MWLQPILVVLGVYYVTIGTVAMTAAIYEEYRSDQNYRRAIRFGMVFPIVPILGLNAVRWAMGGSD
jgi:hypothetical protein